MGGARSIHQIHEKYTSVSVTESARQRVHRRPRRRYEGSNQINYEKMRQSVDWNHMVQRRNLAVASL